MGYTHYFTQKRNLTVAEMRRIGQAAEKIIDQSGLSILREYDSNEPPLISDDVIAFNGKMENGHETFWLQRHREPKATHKYADQCTQGFAFCKTAEKPYDIVVTALLCVVATVAPGAFKIGSDGDHRDWIAGNTLANSATGLATAIPATIRMPEQVT